MSRTICALLFSAVFFCLSISDAGELPIFPEKLTGSGEETENLDELTLITTFSARGSRSEARHHFLKIEGYSVPDVFLRLKYGKYTFTFNARNNQWGDDGYLRSPGFEISPSSDLLSEELRKTGWYEGRERLEGTPENWIYGEWENSAVFSAPEKLTEAVKTLNPPILSRYGKRINLPLRPLPHNSLEEKGGTSKKAASADAMEVLEETLKEEKKN